MFLENLFAFHIRLFRKWRFNHFKKQCTDIQNPSFRYLDGSWLNRKVTADQLRIEQFLETQNLADKNVLHVGIGNSSLAKRFYNKASLIDGITVVEEEERFGNSLQIENYKALFINKYTDQLLSLANTYDIIIDNNLSSCVCCKFHFTEMLRNYLQLLNPHGFIVTDKVGLMHFTNGFGMVFTELKEWEQKLPIILKRVNEFTYTISKSIN